MNCFKAFFDGIWNVNVVQKNIMYSGDAELQIFLRYLEIYWNNNTILGDDFSFFFSFYILFSEKFCKPIWRWRKIIFSFHIEVTTHRNHSNLKN